MSIAIIGAMEEEVAPLLSKLQDVRSLKAGGGKLYAGVLNGQDVVLLQSGIGKVNAAVTATQLLERFHCELIINTGAAGGLAAELKVGDVVIAEELVYSDVDATAFSYAYGQVPQMPPRYPVAAELLALAQKVIGRGGRPEQVVAGLITTADSFISLPERAVDIVSRFPEAKATDMEGAAIAQTAYQFGVPFLAVRSISDIAGAGAAGLFKSHLELAARNSAEVVLELLSWYTPPDVFEI
ncbi:5'-methylthioadenosine/adenosylhomocysteine nucleosidase [Paenibacillus sp. S150]|uniref:5'-methylthioadenosine/adenosylhomocysteine nucleosidase n=1 Tax=Paenibacillus sp. S150 TaxID=2749826 RepID=UPI001C594F61|nr:5'-methylthioadenosine/adenosylhomocysteine nucleosidase [Paenibacillus sp. S150]MBW4083471.1 5'-methylthioadenosine/adenosylhomocysteine nucleosidase [Paenibacillus sp. S150]